MRLKSLMTPGQIVDRLYQIVFDMQKADERLLTRIDFDTITHDEMRSLAAALLTGDTQFVRTIGEEDEQAALDPDWGSWIEGQPMTSAVLTNRSVLVDLLPLDPAEFAAKYRVTVGQFIAIAKWFSKNGKGLHINIRDIDIEDPETFMRYGKQTESIGLILQELEDNALFYCLPARRQLLFSLSERNQPQDRLRLKNNYDVASGFVEEHFPRLAAAYQSLPTNFARTAVQKEIAGAAVRGGELIVDRQLSWRIAYYLSYRAMFADLEENEIDHLLALSNPEPRDIARLARLTTLYHHRFTAPITGAFGGTYNLSIREYGPMLDEITASDPKDRVHGLTSHSSVTEAEQELWRWIATERVKKEKGDRKITNSVSTSLAMMQRRNIVNDEVIDYILNQAKPITDDIQAYRNDLLSSVRSKVMRTVHKSSDPITATEYAELLEDHSAGELLSEMEKAVEKANSVGSAIAGSVVFGFGLAFGTASVSPALTGVVSMFVSPDAVATILEEAAKDPAKSSLSQLVAKIRGRTPSNMMISNIMDDIGALQAANRKSDELGM